jgi:uncharacterized protein (TIGR04255 family)
MPEVFPNAPVKEAIFQVRFPGELAIEGKRHEFQNKVRSEYPTLYVPKVQLEVAPALQAYSFRNEQEKATLNLALNSFSYSTNQYLGFEKFRDRFLSAFSVFQEMFNIPKFSRTGLRYTNHIPILKEQGTIPLAEALKIGLKLPNLIPEKYEEFLVAFATELGEGKLRCIVQHQEEQPQGKEFLLLDFDYFIKGELNPNSIERLLETSHHHTKEVFLSFITEGYLAAMRGETQ